MGLPGSGKTKLGKALEINLNDSKHLQILTILRGIGLKKYSRKKAQLIEDLFFATAKKVLNCRNVLILENVFSTSLIKYNALNFARNCKRETLLIELTTPEIIAKKRIKSRPKKDKLVSDSRDPKHYDKSAMRWESIRIDPHKYPNISTMRFYNHDIVDLSYIENIHITFQIEPLYSQVLQVINQEFHVCKIQDSGFTIERDRMREEVSSLG